MQLKFLNQQLIQLSIWLLIELFRNGFSSDNLKFAPFPLPDMNRQPVKTFITLIVENLDTNLEEELTSCLFIANEKN